MDLLQKIRDCRAEELIKSKNLPTAFTEFLKARIYAIAPRCKNKVGL